MLNIPSDELPRFFTVKVNDTSYIAFLDDIIRNNLDKVFKDCEIHGCYSIKITRDAELDLQDEYPGDLSEEIEKQLKKRDAGLATRFFAPNLGFLYALCKWQPGSSTCKMPMQQKVAFITT